MLTTSQVSAKFVLCDEGNCSGMVVLNFIGYPAAGSSFLHGEWLTMLGPVLQQSPYEPHFCLTSFCGTLINRPTPRSQQANNPATSF